MSAEPSSEPSGGFAPLDGPERLADQVAASLLDSIVSGRLQPGDRLPSERMLCAEFGVSRPVVREAVRSLTTRGLVINNPRVGHTVAGFSPEAMAQTLSLYLRGRHLDYRQLLETRSVVEVATAGLAASRATDADLAALGRALERLKPGITPEEASLADVEFHRQIATATGNPFFELVIDSVRDVMLSVQLPTLARPSILKSSRRAHAAILEQIAAHDVAGAQAAMREHLAEAERGLRKVLAESPGSALID